MCPKNKNGICAMIDLNPNELDCVNSEDCVGTNWPRCSVYNSQFFFDRNDSFIR